MKKVLYVISGFDFTHKDGVFNRCLSFVKCFSDHGYKVTVVSLPYIRQYPGAVKYRVAMPDNAQWLVLPYRFSYKKYSLNLLAFVDKIIIWLIAVFVKPSYILSDDGPSCNMVSIARHVAPMIANFRSDLEDECCYIRNCRIESYEVSRLRKLTIDAARNASYSICVSRKLKDYISNLSGISLKNNFVYPCCADTKRFDGVVNNHDPEIINVGFFGGANTWQCIGQTIDLVSRLRKISDKYHLVLICSGQLDRYREHLDALGKDNFEILSLSNKDMPQAIANMDISVCLRENRNLNIVASPTKLMESLAAGVPLIVTRYCGDYSEMVVDGQTGIVVDEPVVTESELNRIDAFCKEVKSSRTAFSVKCRNAVKNRTQQYFADRFIEFIETR